MQLINDDMGVFGSTLSQRPLYVYFFSLTFPGLNMRSNL